MLGGSGWGDTLKMNAKCYGHGGSVTISQHTVWLLEVIRLSNTQTVKRQRITHLSVRVLLRICDVQG